MQNLSGFVVATGERSHRAVVDAIRSALAHAHALWLGWFCLHHGEAKRDVDTPERIALRIDLALELAPMHRAALQDARVLATLIGDRGRAARATELAKPRGRKHKRA